MNSKKILFALLLNLVMVGVLGAQVTQTGALRGVVTDQEGSPFPGATITVTGPSLMGSESAITTAAGGFRIPSLPPGMYKVVAELAGFKPLTRDDIVIRVGMTVTVNFELAQEAISKEVTVMAPSPPVDVVSTKVTASVGKDVLQALPLARSVYAVLALVPGTTNRSIKGASRNNHAFEVDGIQANATDQNYGEADISWETIEEVEIVTGANSAEVFNGIGGLINVVTRSGGNKFSGQVEGYYTNKDLSKGVVPVEKLKAVGSAPPQAAIFDWDAAAVLGGSIVKDKLWFLGNFRIGDLEQSSAFIPTTINGKDYGPTNYSRTQWWLFGKLSYQPLKNVRSFLMVSYHNWDEPYVQYGGPRQTIENQEHFHRYQVTTSANVAWVLSPNTFIDFRGGNWLQDWWDHPVKEANLDGPAFSDNYTGYSWGRSWASGYTLKKNIQASAKLTHFKDDFLGADHEIKVGLEYQHGEAHWGQWSENVLSWAYYDGNPYNIRGEYGLSGPHPEYGDAILSWSNAPPRQGNKKNTNASIAYKNRIGMFAEDSFTIKKRLTVNLGVRYDHISAGMPALTKEACNDPVARALSAAYIKPIYGIDPYDQFSWPAWKNAFPYNFVSPHVGLAFDLFGNGKTALKASWGLYAEGLPTWHFDGFVPIYVSSYGYYWWDKNGNGQPDLPGIDDYKYIEGWENPTYLAGTDYLQKISKDIKIPYEHQFILGVDHELLPDLRVSLNYTYKKRRDEMTMWLYDRATSRYWSTDTQYWAPFTTTVPAVGDFPAKEVTVYYLKADHPETFTRATNVPNDMLKERYQSIEFSFEKRMSKGWSLGGSVVYTDLKGNVEYAWGEPNGGNFFQTPNYATSRYGTLNFSIPWIIKLFGSYTFPGGFVGSFIYVHLDGNGWGRTITVEPPASWREANGIWEFETSNTVNLEAPGTRRNQGSDNVDLRIEKEFIIGKLGRLGLFVDIFNALGYHSFSANVNPGGLWLPDAEGTNSTGKYIKERTGFNTITGGVRTFKLSARFNF